jgi:hypothetical protein
MMIYGNGDGIARTTGEALAFELASQRYVLCAAIEMVTVKMANVINDGRTLSKNPLL